MPSVGEKALHAALKTRKFDVVYYFYGEDDFLKETRIREVVEVAADPSTRDFNLDQRRGPELDAAMLDSLLSTPPMQAERRVAVIREVDKLKKDTRKLLDDYLKRPSADTVLLLIAPSGVKVDKGLSERSTSIEFVPLTGDRVPMWVIYHAETVLGRTITFAAVSLLVEAVGDDLSLLAMELEKLASFSEDVIDEDAVSAIVGIRRGGSLAALLDAVAARDAIMALPLIPGVLQQPKATAVSIVMSLSTQTLALAYGEAARARGIPTRALFNEYMSLLKGTGAFPGRPWGEAVSAWTKHGDRWSAAALDTALAALLAADEALKETKLSSDEQVLTSLVLALCGSDSSRRTA